MHRAHTADAGPATIFIHNGAPQALVGCQASERFDDGKTSRRRNNLGPKISMSR